MIHKDFLNQVNYLSDYIETNNSYPFVINFDWGFVYNPYKSDVRFSKQGSNPFITRVEDKAVQAETVWGVKHTEAHLLGKKVNVGHANMPMWVQVIHGTNVSNRMQGSPYSLCMEPPFDIDFREYLERNYK
jgi:hypothetical protein